MRTRVLMLGPQAFGGISTLIQTIVPNLEQRADFLYVPTVLRRPLSKAGKISVENISLAITQYTRLIAALRRFHPQVVHIHTSQGLGWLKDSVFILLSKIAGCQVILHVHAADFGELYGQKRRVIRWYTRRIMGMADAVVAVSTEWKARLANIVDPARIHILRNCISIDDTPLATPRARANGMKALFMGSIGARKGIFDLLEAMSYVKEQGSHLVLWIAGSEERAGEMAKAQSWADALHLGDVCQFVGDVRGEGKKRLLSAAHIFVLPSYHEGLPMAILEALSAGLPVIASAVGGIPEIVLDGHNGYLVNPGDVKALAEKLILLANDPLKCEEMGKRSREIAQQELNVEIYCERLVALYESLVAAS